MQPRCEDPKQRTRRRKHHDDGERAGVRVMVMRLHGVVTKVRMLGDADGQPLDQQPSQYAEGRQRRGGEQPGGGTAQQAKHGEAPPSRLSETVGVEAHGGARRRHQATRVGGRLWQLRRTTRIALRTDGSAARINETSGRRRRGGG